MISQSERKNTSYVLRFTLRIYLFLHLFKENAQMLFLYNRQKSGVLRAFTFPRVFQNMITTFH